MRLRRSTPGLSDEANAPVLVQLGDKFHSIPLNAPPKAEKLLFGSVRVTSSHHHLDDAHRSPPGDAREGYEALVRMKEALAEPDGRSSKYAWSPDHLGQPHPYDVQPNHSRNPERLDREPSDAGPPSYHEPYAASQHLPPPTTHHDMAVHQGTPTIFDNIGGTPTPRRYSSREAMRQHQVSRRQTTGHANSLQLNHMFPTPRPSTGRLLSPNRQSASPTPADQRNDRRPPPPSKDSTKTTTRRARFAESGSVRPSKSAGGLTSKKKVFDEDILDQHKTNVRRPPKGIQNWFDAYLESEDEEGDEEDEEEGGVQEAMRGHPIEFPEPQELPADDILPPAYSAPSREISRASLKSNSQTRPDEPPTQPTQQVSVTNAEREEISRYRSSDTNSWDSIQSSHIGRIPPDAGDVNASRESMGGQSVLSLSESDYGDTDEEDGGHLPPIRDSIFDDKNVVFASASSVALHKLQRPSQLREMSSFSHESEAQTSKTSDTLHSQPSSRVSNATPKTRRGDKLLPGAPAERLHPTAEQVALRRLNGLSLESRTTSRSDTAFHEAGGEGQPPVDAQHVMAVTEEEKMLLDLMRRKRAVMQQLSFTEGYQLALLTEQQRLAKRSTSSAELSALKAVHRRQSERRDSQVESLPSPTQHSSESDMRRQLSAIRKEQVDERFQLERFLGMSQPQPLSSHPPHDASQHETAAESPHDNTQSAELLPATVYSPVHTPSGPSPAFTQGSFPSEGNDQEAVKRRVRYFIETKGAVPPLNTTLKTMRRKSNRAVSSMPPSPVIEEEHPPVIPTRSPDRHKREALGAPHATANSYHSLAHKHSSVSMDDEPRDKSPVSNFPPPMSRFNSMCRSQNIDIQLSPELIASRSTESFRNSGSSQQHDQVSQPSTSPPDNERFSPVSPFSSIITAASKPNHHHHHQYQYHHLQRDSSLPRGVKRVPNSLPKLHTAEPVDSRGSLVSITSAGEEVLAAWGELGGGNEAFPRMKMKKSGEQEQEQEQVEETPVEFVTPKTPGQGPLSGIMNGRF